MIRQNNEKQFSEFPRDEWDGWWFGRAIGPMGRRKVMINWTNGTDWTDRTDGSPGRIGRMIHRQDGADWTDVPHTTANGPRRARSLTFINSKFGERSSINPIPLHRSHQSHPTLPKLQSKHTGSPSADSGRPEDSSGQAQRAVRAGPTRRSGRPEREDGQARTSDQACPTTQLTGRRSIFAVRAP